MGARDARSLTGTWQNVFIMFLFEQAAFFLIDVVFSVKKKYKKFVITKTA
jgi:hypothetical protein